MRIGLIARADNTGLGIQSKEFFDHIPCKAFVIDSSLLAPSHTEILMPNIDRFPGQQVFQVQPGHDMIGAVPLNLIEDFVKDIDILFAMETPYDYNFFSVCRNHGVKTILQLNYEFLDYPSGLPHPDLFAAPSPWHYEDIPNPKIFLPVPVNTKHFHPLIKPKTFVHIAGRPAIHDRNGTLTFFQSLQYVNNEINVALYSQRPFNINGIRSPKIHLMLHFGSTPNYHENYSGGVLVMPRKYGGLCLPINEAIGAEMPVITTCVSPNNSWLPNEWLVSPSESKSFRAKKQIDVFETDPYALAQKIDEFCDDEFYDAAIKEARRIKNEISWQTLLPLYNKTFADLMV